VLLFKSSLFNFVGVNDGYYSQNYGLSYIDALKEDRKMIFTEDTLRTLVLVLLSAGIIWMFLKKKLSETKVIILFAGLILFDLVGVDRRYVNNDNFISSLQVNRPFQPHGADKAIIQDTDNFRVFDVTSGGGRASYFHNALGGYHAAKLKRFNDLNEFHISKNNINVLNMLNTKYIIAQDEEGNVFPYTNTDANGNAWFVDEVKIVASSDEEILLLDSLDTKSKAIYTKTNEKQPILDKLYQVDSTAHIKVLEYKPNYIKYESNNAQDGFVVFSEIFYGNGWISTLDNEEVSHFRVNYALRGMPVKSGKHIIEFRFEPQVVKTGSQIALASSILFGILIMGGLFYEFKNKPTTSA